MTSPVQSELLGADRAIARAERLYATMSLRNKRRYNYYLGLEVGKLARRNIKQQKDIDGQPFAKRRVKPSKKVLTQLARRKRLKIYSDPAAATITWKGYTPGVVAAKHQRGVGQKARALKGSEIRAKKLASGKPAGVAPATEAQKKALQRLGVDVAALGALTWLRAGVIIRDIRRKLAGTEQKARKTDWSITLPQREFLGVANKDRAELRQKLFDKILSDVETGRV